LYFKEYKNIKKIQDLSNSVSMIQGDLRRQVEDDFLNSFDHEAGLLPGRTQILVEACELIEVLGPEVKYIFFKKINK